MLLQRRYKARSVTNPTPVTNERVVFFPSKDAMDAKSNRQPKVPEGLYQAQIRKNGHTELQKTDKNVAKIEGENTYPLKKRVLRHFAKSVVGSPATPIATPFLSPHILSSFPGARSIVASIAILLICSPVGTRFVTGMGTRRHGTVSVGTGFRSVVVAGCGSG